MRFLADIPIARTTIEHLRTLGHSVVAVSEKLSPTAPDGEIVRLAVHENRIILCFDLDFASLVAVSGEALPSVITFRTSMHRGSVINNRLDAVLPEITTDLVQGALVTVEDHRVRIRALPLRRPQS